MTQIHLNLNNFLDFNALLGIFPESNQYEFTSKKIFRLKIYVICSCGCQMTHNGFNFVRKKGFGKAKIGKQKCPKCGNTHIEDKGFWKNLLSKWVETTTSFILALRDSDVAWSKISELMNYILPCSKDKARYLFNNKIEQFNYPQAIEKGLPIGSGKIESANSYVVQARMKITGAWWKVENIDKILSLLTCKQNGKWNKYWQNIQKVA